MCHGKIKFSSTHLPKKEVCLIPLLSGSTSSPYQIRHSISLLPMEVTNTTESSGPIPKLNSHIPTSPIPHSLCKQSHQTLTFLCIFQTRRGKRAVKRKKGGREFCLIIKRQTISCYLQESCLLKYLIWVLFNLPHCRTWKREAERRIKQKHAIAYLQPRIYS